MQRKFMKIMSQSSGLTLLNKEPLNMCSAMEEHKALIRINFGKILG